MSENTPDTQTTQPTAPSEPAAGKKKDGKAPMSKARQFYRKALLWLVIILAAFLGGVVTDHFVRYVPLAESLKDVQAAVDEATQEVDALRAETERLQSVDDELETATAHLTLLQVLNDVLDARMALQQQDTTGAQAALSDTVAKLDALLPLIRDYDASMADSMPQRLNLIISEVGQDNATARIDLELFNHDLLEIEAALFGE